SVRAADAVRKSLRDMGRVQECEMSWPKHAASLGGKVGGKLSPTKFKPGIGNPFGNGAISHGHCRGQLSPTYWSWKAMLRRCRDPKRKDYGARGVTVCARWDSAGDRGRRGPGFANFLSDMGERPDGKT